LAEAQTYIEMWARFDSVGLSRPCVRGGRTGAPLRCPRYGKRRQRFDCRSRVRNRTL